MTRNAVLVLDFAIGLMIGVVLHYYLYRVGLPLVPFIYQAF
jgi:hypothetical protein